MNNNGYYGIYRAKVLDNADPRNQGRVLLHIYAIDGEFNYTEDQHNWVPVLSPYGGISQMGLYMIPPIHAEGYVIFEEGNVNKPVWIGTYPFSAVTEVDEEASKSAGYTVLKQVPTIPPELTDPTRVIWKTQYLSKDNPEPDSDQNKVENIIVMDEKVLELVHVTQSEYKYEQGGVGKGNACSFFSLGENSVSIGVKGADSKVHQINITNKGIKLETPLGDTIQMTDGNIQLKGSQQCQIQIEALDAGSIIINGKQVLVDGENIIAGPPGSNGGGGVVTCDTVCPFVGLPIHIGSSKLIAGG